MIFIFMEITRATFEKTLSNFLSHKYNFVERVEITRGPYIKYGMFVLSITIISVDGLIKKIRPECVEKFEEGDEISFWTIIKCFGKFYDMIGLEKDIQKIYSELSGGTSYSRDIEVKIKLY